MIFSQNVAKIGPSTKMSCHIGKMSSLGKNQRFRFSMKQSTGFAAGAKDSMKNSGI